MFVDESHVTIPQIGGMSRATTGASRRWPNIGFRLPSCIDNRPLRFNEWDAMRPQTTYVSATPGEWEMEQTGGVFAEQVIRPTGLIDPPVEIRPVETRCTTSSTNAARHRQGLSHAGHHADQAHGRGPDRIHARAGLKVRYMHSDVETLERIELIRDLRLGVFDVLVGINLLREGLDIPECGLVAILDADKEGFLRSETSLIQTIGRAARNVDGRVILYADRITGSMERAIAETDRRREKQQAFNEANGITPAVDQAEHRRHRRRATASRDHVIVDTGSTRAAQRRWSATICAPTSRTLKSACARRRRTWNSRRRRGCATR